MIKRRVRKAPRRNTILIIMDGVGVNPSKKNNAVYEANTPNLDRYYEHHAHMTLQASGRSVGLPTGQMGNSEVGHMTIGCGSIVNQDIVRIDDSIASGRFYKLAALLATLEAAKALNRPLHLLGLVSDGGVHSHISHLFALIDLCKQHNVQPMIHMITDGRDTSPRSAMKYVQALEEKLAETENGKIATICGRFYAMDRDNRWERTKVAWDALIHGEAEAAENAQAAIESAYAAGEYDEFIKPRIMPDAELIKAEDSLLFFNFRNDRPRQMAAALAKDDFDNFDRGDYEPIIVTCLTEYDKSFLAPVVFSPHRPGMTLAETISLAGYKQFHCAETEKYAHVTFFMNGGRETPFAGETRTMVKSPNVETYDLAPEMSAKEVANAVIKALNSQEPAFIVVNFANGDMVGHTAIPDAVVKAVEILDKEVGRVLDAAVENEYSVLLTSDHGNCDEYIDPVTQEPHTQHTIYPVPCLIIDSSRWRLRTGGGLSNIAPTVLQLMGLRQPSGMESSSLLLNEV